MTGGLFGPSPRSLGPEADRVTWVDRVGRQVRLRARDRMPSLAEASDRLIGVSLVSALPFLFLAPPLALVGPLGVVAVSLSRARRRRRTTERALNSGLADLLDQLALAVGSGLTLSASLRVVAPLVPGAYKPLVNDALRRLDSGAGLVGAIGVMADACPRSARRALSVVTAAVRDGTPIGSSLAQAAEEARRSQRRIVEILVRRLPVLLLGPLVLCILPAFVLLTLVPLVLGSLDGLQFPGS